MSQRTDPRATFPLLVAAGCLAAVLAGCRRAADVQSGDIRTYTVAKETPAERSIAATTTAAAVRYELPAGWSDRGASGMRLAALAVGDPAAGDEVTVIPAAGTLRGNVERWQGQLDAEAGEAERTAAVERALAAAEVIDVDGASATVVALFDAAASAGPDASGQAILGAMIPVGEGSSLFVKYKGDAAVARRERAAFVRFVESLRWREPADRRGSNP